MDFEGFPLFALCQILFEFLLGAVSLSLSECVIIWIIALKLLKINPKLVVLKS